MPDEKRRTYKDRSRIFILFLNDRLNSLTPARAWLALGSSMIAIPVGDYLVHPIGVHLGPLYVLPICLACWRLNMKVGLGIAVFAAALSVAMRSVSHHDLVLGAVLANMVLQAFALCVVAAIVSNFRFSFERERIVARHDGITGALTRSSFEQRAKSMMAAAAAERQPLLLAFLDLDGFKTINDRYGHGAGDLVLKRFADECRSALRREDCFGRMGGDEFAVLMRLPSAELAQETAERLHERFNATLAGTAYDATCSMGALVVPPAGNATLDELMREADRLMYTVKHDGKSGVRFGTLAPPLEPDLQLLTGSNEDISTPTGPKQPVASSRSAKREARN